MSTKRLRLLELLRLLYPEKSKDELLSSVLCGEVSVNNETVRDPKQTVQRDADIAFKRKAFVSRGGEKLEHALAVWETNVRGKILLDAGASTGGFTDCLLKRGARLVHAVDVGYNQIHMRFRTDEHVRVREKTNIMSLESLDPQPDLAVCDLSFRSLRNAARHILDLTREKQLIALVKPQFEWIDPPPDFDGVVRSENDLKHILAGLEAQLRSEGVSLQKVLESPIRGRAGNREFLVFLVLDEAGKGS